MSSTEGISIPPGVKLLHTLNGHTSVSGLVSIESMAWSHDGKLLASASNDRTVRIWDAVQGTCLRTLKGHTRGANYVAWSPDGKLLASKSWDEVLIWDAAEGTPLFTLPGNDYSYVRNLAWSPDGNLLACASFRTGGSGDPNSSGYPVWLWNAARGTLLHQLVGLTDDSSNVTWSPDGKLLASGSRTGPVLIWDALRNILLHTLTGHKSSIGNVAWSPDGKMLASGSFDNTVRIWDVTRGTLLHELTGHTNAIRIVAWSPDGKLLASGTDPFDQTVRIWDAVHGTLLHTLTGFIGIIHDLIWSPDGRLLISSANPTLNINYHNEFRFWRTDTWDCVGVVTDLWGVHDIAWHPSRSLLLTIGQSDNELTIWELDIENLVVPLQQTIHYTNAKVVLVGDSGVGKSALALVLTGSPFVATESTHGRHVWALENEEVEYEDNRKELHETLLWDLAGQPDYRLIHQLHLHDATVAQVIFDASRETDSFAGVRHWDRALRVAEKGRGVNALPLKKFLVAARTDRGGRNVSRERTEALIQELGFDGYFETSAKTGRNIAELTMAIRKAIAWESLPKVTSTQLFQRIKQFLVRQKESGILLSTESELFRSFEHAEYRLGSSGDLAVQFRTCLGLVEGSGLVRSLSFGGLVLLQPELLDAYASALVIAVKDEPDGLGSISEDQIRQGKFPIPQEERLTNKKQEELLLIAMIEELLRHDIAFREHGNLIFPSQTNRDYPDPSTIVGKTVSFIFEGPVLSVTTTLKVRLAQSGLFQKKDLWKDVVIYTARAGGTYGVYIRQLGEERAELFLFFDQAADEELRYQFELFIQDHLRSHALAETLQRRRLFVCPNCGEPFAERLVQSRIDRHLDWIQCNNCDNRVSLRDGEARLEATSSTQVQVMNERTNNERNRQASVSVIEGKRATGDFDVFLCHHGPDKPAVKEIGVQLKEYGILPWLDVWELRPGLPWQRLLEEQISQIKSAAVFIGKSGIGPWQQQELEAFLREFAQRGCPVIPVLLADAPLEPALPVFLKAMTWVDFRGQDPDPMQQLIWGITGRREATRGMQGSGEAMRP